MEKINDSTLEVIIIDSSFQKAQSRIRKRIETNLKYNLKDTRKNIVFKKKSYKYLAIQLQYKKQ